MKRQRNKPRPKFQQSDHQSPTTTTTADFSFTLTRIAVSQICQSVGYRATDTSSLDTLTLITTKFLQSLAGLAASFSNTANRTEVNLFDIVNSLEYISLSTSDWFPGGSTGSHCLIKSAVLRNLSDFVTYAPEIPFAKPLPKREIDGDLRRIPPSNRSSEVVNKSVPAWLPPFPDPSLYLQRSTQERSDHLWENSDSVVGCETIPESLKSESCGDGSGGILPKRRGRVRFKVELDRSSDRGGGDTRLERWRDNNNDGEFGSEVEGRKKIIGEFIYSTGEWGI